MSRRSVAVAVLVVSAACLLKTVQLHDEQLAQDALEQCQVRDARPVLVAGGPTGFELTGFTVTDVVAPACAGRTVHLSVRDDGQGLVSGTGPYTTGGLVVLDSPVAASQVNGYRFVVG